MVKQCRGDGGFKLLATKGVQCVGKLCRNGKLLTFEQTCKEHDRPKKKEKEKNKHFFQLFIIETFYIIDLISEPPLTNLENLIIKIWLKGV